MAPAAPISTGNGTIWHARDHQVGVMLRSSEVVVDRQAVFVDEMRDDGVAVADDLAAIVDIGQLPARRLRGIKDVLVRERDTGELQESINLEPVTVVVGNAAQRRPGIEREHRAALR